MSCRLKRPRLPKYCFRMSSMTFCCVRHTSTRERVTAVLGVVGLTASGPEGARNAPGTRRAVCASPRQVLQVWLAQVWQGAHCGRRSRPPCSPGHYSDVFVSAAIISAISAGKILQDIKAKNTRLCRRIHCVSTMFMQRRMNVCAACTWSARILSRVGGVQLRSKTSRARW